MSIVRLENVSLAYGLRPLLDNVNFAIEEKQKICMLGRNGEGKYYLMSLMTKSYLPDSGEVNLQKGYQGGSPARKVCQKQTIVVFMLSWRRV